MDKDRISCKVVDMKPIEGAQKENQALDGRRNVLQKVRKNIVGN
jgi:hypothetical protein